MSAPPLLRPGSDDHESVMALQRALNTALVPSPQLGVKGNFKGRTEQAVKDFQLMVGLYPDGVVGPRTWHALKSRGFAVHAPGTSGVVPPPMAPTGDQAKDAPWMQVARAEQSRHVVAADGTEADAVNREEAGYETNNPRIVEYLATYGYLGKIPVLAGKKVAKLGTDGRPVLDKKGKPVLADPGMLHAAGPHKGEKVMMGEVDETPWCAAFVGWCMTQAGKPLGKTSARAESWKDWGSDLTAPRYGCVAVVYKTPSKALKATTASGWHVALYVKGDAEPGGTGSLVLLGGNQGDKEGAGKKRHTVSGGRVSEAGSTGYWTVKAYRWPA